MGSPNLTTNIDANWDKDAKAGGRYDAKSAKGAHPEEEEETTRSGQRKPRRTRPQREKPAVLMAHGPSQR